VLALTGSATAIHASEDTVHYHKHRRSTLVPELFGPRLHVDATDTKLLQKLRIPNTHLPTINRTDYTFAGNRLEITHIMEREVALACRCSDRRSEWMLTLPFETGGQPKHYGFIKIPGWHHRHHPRFSFGQGSRLVNYERIDFLESLERFSVLDQHTCGGSFPDANHD